MCQWIGWRENVKRKAPYSMGKSMMSRLRFSRLNQSIEWEIHSLGNHMGICVISLGFVKQIQNKKSIEPVEIGI
jgi:hypothetical protein